LWVDVDLRRGVVAEGLRCLWHTAAAIVTEDGYSYAVRGREFTADLRLSVRAHLDRGGGDPHHANEQ
jgi:hypothetical protein